MQKIIRIMPLVLSIFITACTTTSTTFTSPINKTVNSSGYDKQKAAAARLNLGLRYLAQGDYVKAKFNLDKALVHDPQNENVIRGTAWYYEQVSEVALAQQFYLKAIKINPNNPELLNQYGVFLCRNNHLNESLKMFSTSAKMLTNRDMSGTYENAATCNLQSGNLEQAERFYRKALNHNSEQRDSLLGMASIEFNKGRYHRSRSYMSRFERVAKHNPRSLWLGIRTESYLGNMDAVASYGLKLEQMFPDSQETANYLDTRSQWLK